MTTLLRRPALVEWKGIYRERGATWLVWCLVGVLWLYPSMNAGGQSTEPPSSQRQSSKNRPLDQQLFDELQNELLEGLENLPSKPADDDPGGASKSSVDESPKIDPQLLDQLGEGEDIELGESGDPLTRIGQKMRTVEELMIRQQTSAKTQRLQKEILAELAKLVEMQRKRSAGRDGGSSDQPRATAKSDGNLMGGSQAISEAGRPQNSSQRIGKSAANTAEIVSREDLLREAWGELPERFLQQFRGAGVEHFLPKYEKLIEQYYKRLAEISNHVP